MRGRPYLLADSDHNGSFGSHMDSSADPADNRDHELGGSGITGKVNMTSFILCSRELLV